MLINYKNKTYEIAKPIPKHNEILLKVTKYIEIKTPENSVSEIFKFSNSISKLFFFLIHEGFRLTWNKVKSSFFQRDIIKEKKMVFAYEVSEDEAKYVVGVGPQYCLQAEYYLFPSIFTCIVEEKKEIEYLYQLLKRYFNENPDKLNEIYHYSYYSGNKIDFSLDQILKAKSIKSYSQKETIPFQSSIFKKPNRTSKNNIDRNGFDLFLVGAGVYSCAYILPELKVAKYHTIIDLNPILATVASKKYNFKYCDTSYERALKKLQDCKKPILIVATYHSTHVDIVEKALTYNSDTKIIIEKPPVTSFEQLSRLIELKNKGHFIEIGYNRRYIPFIKRAKSKINEYQGPITITCIVKEKTLPMSHWYYWPTQGTRITGNVSHWIDLGIHLIQKNPISFTVVSASEHFYADDPSISILFEDKSILNIIASDRGNPLRGIQEFIDIRRGDLAIQIDDFLSMKIQEKGAQKQYRKLIRDKGHSRMYANFMEKCNGQIVAEYSIEDLRISSELYLNINNALKQNKKYMEL